MIQYCIQLQSNIMCPPRNYNMQRCAQHFLSNLEQLQGCTLHVMLCAMLHAILHCVSQPQHCLMGILGCVPLENVEGVVGGMVVATP